MISPRKTWGVRPGGGSQHISCVLSALGLDGSRRAYKPSTDPVFSHPSCAFVTYEKMESADQAVAELNGTQVESVQLKVSIARKQPMLDAATGKSVWGSLAVQNSPKGCHRDKRTQIVYSDDVYKENLVDGF